MWIQVPNSIQETLWEGSFILDENARKMRGRRVTHTVEASSFRNLPIASIGQPQIWSLTDIYTSDKISPLLKVQLEAANFYLIRLSCSFRTTPESGRVVWARFTVQMPADYAGYQPVVYDLYPLLINHEIKKNIKVKISPKLKFQEIEASTGELESGFEYTNIQPIVSASGAGEFQSNWDYEEFKGSGIQGSKWMHLLLKVPNDMQRVRATLDITADVETQGIRVPVFLRDKQQEQDRLSVWLV